MPSFYRRLLSGCNARYQTKSGHWAGVAGALLAGLLSHRAHAQDSTFTRLATRNRYALSQNGPQFSGAGWEKLRQDIRQSQFVLVGEDHGTAQIPAFTAAVAREFKPAVYVAEIDPYQAQDLTRLAAQPGLPTAVEHQYPFGLTFYSWAEEFELARSLRAQQVPIIGLDQVGYFSPGPFFARLAEQAQSPVAKAYLRGRSVAYQAQDRAAMLHGTSKFSIYQRPAALDSLRTITRPESPAVRQMVQDFIASAAIFEAQRTGAGGHQERINLMKHNLLQGLTAYQRPGQPVPKLLFKFGAIHMSRGISLLSGVYDVGNLVLNLADAQDQQSLHVLIAGRQGTKVHGFNPVDFSKNVAPYSNAKEAFVQPFPVPANDPSWQVFDLRPLRKALLRDKLKVASQDLAIILLGYDYVILIPETTASHNY